MHFLSHSTILWANASYTYISIYALSSLVSPPLFPTFLVRWSNEFQLTS